MQSVVSKLKRESQQLRRDEIERAAMRSILKHGFPDCSLRVVAKEARLPLSIIHYYYRDKDALMAQAARRIFDATMAELEAVAHRERDPARRAIALTKAFTMTATENWRAMLAFIEYWAACVRRGSGDRFYSEVHRRIRQLLTEALREAQAEDAGNLGLALLAMATGYAMFYRSKEPAPTERAALLKYASGMVVRAVRKGRTPMKAAAQVARKEA
jgi:AcrR family transcriptional regulator